jgi:hypothetical protein
VTPQLAAVSENGEPEYHIPESVMDRLGGGRPTNVQIIIQGVDMNNVDAVREALARGLREAGI